MLGLAAAFRMSDVASTVEKGNSAAGVHSRTAFDSSAWVLGRLFHACVLLPSSNIILMAPYENLPDQENTL